MRAVIGVSCPWSEETWGPTIDGGGYDYAGRAYAAALYRAGAIPVLIPNHAAEDDLESYADAILRTVDGLYFTGGGNVRRVFEGGLPTLYEQQPVRSRWEDLLLKKAYAQDVPCFGVCRGYQMMAVAFGGCMDTVRLPQHKQTVPYDQGIHNITAQPGSLLAQLVGETPWCVNSIHVERVARVPEGFRVDALAEDGSIEALSAVGKSFFMGTQFHPELMPEDPHSQQIFNALVRAAESHKAMK